ncbi:translocation/assembly module TamB domain-containing protein [Candidatus Magnetominusculus dajiuhuensis]|uniref:translocation/assembly module TamB domain-containing protein n=1 Tax=Candidatus Magnetominusculus dajiuhuensis TaxID=3137712 RepID=UPI003B429ABE
MANLELRKKYLKFVLILAVIYGAILSAHYYGSRYAKEAMSVELKKLFGDSVAIDSLQISIFPLQGSINGLSIKDEQGNQIIKLKSARAYLRILPLIFKRITIQKFYVDTLYIDADSTQIDMLMRKLKKDDKSGESPSTIEIVSLDIKRSSVKFRDKGRDYSLSLADIKGQLTTREIWAKLSDIDFDSNALKHDPAIKPHINSITFKAVSTPSSLPSDSYNINLLSIMADGAEIRAKGGLKGGKIELFTKANIKIDYLKRVLGLKESGVGDIKLSGVLGYDGKEPNMDVSVEGKIPVETLLELIGEKEPIFGETAFKAKVSGTLKTLKATGQALMARGGFYGVAVDTLSCGILYEDFKLKFHDGKATLYNGKATRAEVVLNMPKVTHFTLDVDVEDIDSQPVFKLIEWDPGVSAGKVSGNIKSAGRLFDPDASFKYVRLKDAKATSALNIVERIDEITGSVSVRGDNVTIHEANIRTPLSEGKITGTLDTKTDVINMRATVRTSEAADLLRPYSEDLHGTGTYEGDIRGTGKNPLITGTVDLSNGNLFGIGFVHSKSALRYVKERLTIENGAASLNTGTCTYDGTATIKDAKHIFDFNNPALAISISAKDIAIKDMATKHPAAAEAEGIINTSFKITGTPQRLRFDGSLDIPALTAFKANMGRLTSLFTYEADVIKLENLTVAKGGSSLSADMSISKKGRPWHDIKAFTYNVKSRGCALNIKDTPAADYAVDGALSCTFSGEGSLNSPSLTFSAASKDLRAKGLNIGATAVNGTMRKNAIELSGNIFDGKVAARGRLSLSKAMPWSADVEMKRGNYEFLASGFMKEIPPELKLYAEGKAALSGTRHSITGTMNMPLFNLSAGEFTFSNTAPVGLSIADRAITFNSFALKSGPAKFTITGGLVIGRSYNLRLEGSPKLKFFQGVSEKIAHLNGDASISVSLLGDWKTPQISGETDIKDGSIGFKNAKYFINEINGKLIFDSNKMVVSGLTGRVGGGTFTGNGAVNLNGFHIKQFYLDGKLKDMPFTDSDGFKLKYEGDVVYRGTADRQILSGTIVVDMAKYTKGITWQDLIFGSRPGQSASGAFKDTQLNLSIKGDKNILIDNNIAETGLKLDVILRGTLSQPLIYGRVTAEGGKVRFMNREFDIINGNLDFPGTSDINPYLNVMAETTMKGYNIRMFLDGQLKRFNLTMTSEPKLKEADILKLFAGPDGGSTAAASIITGKYQNIVEERIRALTGLNRFEVTSSTSEDKSTVTPQVTISKKFLNNKLNVLLTSGTTKGEVIKLEYKLNSNTSLVGERSDIGSLGADVKFRFTFK